MYHHVSTFDLDLGQLWRCPVSWCTVWKDTPQDCMHHVRGVHDVPLDIKSASLDRFFPPWTVRRQIWADALDHVIREFLRMFYSSVRSTSLWFTTTGCSGGGCPISPSARLPYPVAILWKISKKIKSCYWSEMERNAIESDFRSSKIAASNHFVIFFQKTMNLHIDLK